METKAQIQGVNNASFNPLTVALSLRAGFVAREFSVETHNRPTDHFYKRDTEFFALGLHFFHRLTDTSCLNIAATNLRREKMPLPKRQLCEKQWPGKCYDFVL
jgi:hypothetical protein